ncbi:hypothetical protein ACU4HD_38150 [Cupriavidus basilensis]
MASSVLLRSVELNVLDELQLAGAFHLGAGHGLMMHGLSPGQVVIVRASVSAAPRGSQFIVLKAVFAEFERWRAIRAGRNGIPECIAGRPAGVGAALISKCRAARATLELPRGVRAENPSAGAAGFLLHLPPSEEMHHGYNVKSVHRFQQVA